MPFGTGGPLAYDPGYEKYRFSPAYDRQQHSDYHRRGRGVMRGSRYVVPVSQDIEAMHPKASRWTAQFLAQRPAWQPHRGIILKVMLGMEQGKYAEFEDVVDAVIAEPQITNPAQLMRVADMAIAQRLGDLGMSLEDWNALHQSADGHAPAGDPDALDRALAGYAGGGPSLPPEVAPKSRSAQLRGSAAAS